MSVSDDLSGRVKKANDLQKQRKETMESWIKNGSKEIDTYG